MKISADHFLGAFADEWEVIEREKQPSELCPYQDRPRWTKFMLGPNGVMARVGTRLRTLEPTLQYKQEVYYVDGLFVGGNDLYGSNLSYPSHVHVLIEHEMENQIEEEMWKLLFWRAPLKVIFFYDWAEDEKLSETRKRWLREKLRKLVDMLNYVLQRAFTAARTCGIPRREGAP